jgi:Caspase domain
VTPWFSAHGGAAGPRTHAFVLGVSRYQHLPKRPQDPVSDATFGLRQLESAATSAVKFARWMTTTYNRPEAPLGDLWLLLSPSAKERRRLSDEERGAPAATRAAVKAALDEWRQACEADREGIAVFYASGHGIILGPQEGGSVLLEDFHADPNRRMENTLNVVEARSGMAGPNAPGRQFWFLDACQPEVQHRGVVLRSTGLPGWDGHIPEKTEASPIYMSATTGTLAFGKPGKGTLFSEALEDCLGLRAVGLSDDGQWVINDTTLGRRLKERIAALARDAKADQTADFGGRPGDVPFHVLATPPRLPFALAVVPEAARDCAFGTLTAGPDGTVFERKRLRRPAKATVTAGNYIVKVAIDPPTDTFASTELAWLVAPNRADLLEVAVQR